MRGDEGIDGEVGNEATHEDAGAGEQHQGESELEDDEDGGEPTAAAAAEAARAFTEDGAKFGPGGAERGKRAEEQSAEDAESGEVAEHRVVGGELDPVGTDLDGGLVKPADAEGGEAKAEKAAGGAEEEAFNEQLAHHAPAGGAEGGTDGHLALAIEGAAQHHVGDIGAGNEQHKADGAEHEQEDEADATAIEPLLEGEHADADVLVLGVLAREAGGDAVELGLRLDGETPGFRMA